MPRRQQCLGHALDVMGRGEHNALRIAEQQPLEGAHWASR